ncbi:MAG: hypothetical protein ACTH4U_20200, partial [Pseudoalteromonas prydzensis]
MPLIVGFRCSQPQPTVVNFTAGYSVLLKPKTFSLATCSFQLKIYRLPLTAYRLPLTAYRL